MGAQVGLVFIRTGLRRDVAQGAGAERKLRKHRVDLLLLVRLTLLRLLLPLAPQPAKSGATQVIVIFFVNVFTLSMLQKETSDRRQ